MVGSISRATSYMASGRGECDLEGRGSCFRLLLLQGVKSNILRVVIVEKNQFSVVYQYLIYQVEDLERNQQESWEC